MSTQVEPFPAEFEAKVAAEISPLQKRLGTLERRLATLDEHFVKDVYVNDR